MSKSPFLQSVASGLQLLVNLTFLREKYAISME